MSDKNLQELTLQMKREVHGKNKKIEQFAPLSSEIKRVHAIDSSFKETDIPGSSLSKVLPQIFIKKIVVDNNPTDSTALDDSRRDPHIADHPVYKRRATSKTMLAGRKKSSSFNPLGPSSDFTGDFSTSVELTITVKQLFDDDDMLYEILKTLGLQDYLRLKIIAVLDNENTEKAVSRVSNGRDIALIRTNEDQGIYVIGHDKGISIPQDYSKNSSPTSSEFEISSDGSVIKNIIIKRSFQFSKPPENLAFFVQAYYDVFNNPEFESQLGVSVGSMLNDANLSKTLISKMKSEVVFRSSQLMSQAAVFTETPPALGSIGSPYGGPIVEVKPDVFAKPAKTTVSGARNDQHSHQYYVDAKGNGYTNVHTDRNNRQHVHIIRSFKVSSSGKYGDLQETFTEHPTGAHVHSIPLAASNALYRRMVPVDYIVDNRTQGSLGSLRMQTNKTIEDTFSFLRKARRRSNIISSAPGSSELSPITCRNSKDSYFTRAMMTSDSLGNCRFVFGFDHPSWIRNHTRFGKYISSFEESRRFAEIQSVTILRRKLTNSEYSKSKTYKLMGPEPDSLFKDEVVCVGFSPGSGTNKGITGTSATATISEFTPAGNFGRQNRALSGRFFTICDRSYTVKSPTTRSTIGARELPKRQDEPQVLSGGTYVYGVELSIVDNTVGFLTEAQGILRSNIRKLKDYIAIGQRRENHSGISREFTKAFRTKITSEYAREIVDSTMVALSRIFIDESGNTLFSSKRDFETKAKKMHNAIRPKSGSLYAAERYLFELSGIVSYISDISRSESVGPYAARKQSSNSPKNSDFPQTSKAGRLKKFKFYFKDCFEKMQYDNSDLYFSTIPGFHPGLSEVSVSSIHGSSDPSRATGNYGTESEYQVKGNISLQPQFGKLNSGTIVPVDEKYIKEKMFSPYDSNRTLRLGADSFVSTFKVVSNESLLKERVFDSSIDTFSTKNIMGDTELEKQILELQEDGWLSGYKKQDTSSVKETKALVLGSELVEQLSKYKKTRRHRVMYFGGIKSTKGSFMANFSRLSGQALRRLSNQNRPILCMIEPMMPRTGEKPYEGLCYDKYFFIMPERNTPLYSPVRSSFGSILDPITTTYNSETMTTNPQVEDATSTNRGGSIGNSSSGTSSMGSSGGY